MTEAGNKAQKELLVALAGNPNVGKSTVFNALTGGKQHTGNWPGKTVGSAYGRFRCGEREAVLVDLPGAYSLLAHSAEEEVARDFLCFGGADAAVVVCDATCLERNLNLVLQTLELKSRAVVLINLMDEAEKKGIRVDIPRLEGELGVPVVAARAREGKGLDMCIQRLSALCEGQEEARPAQVFYGEALEAAIERVRAALGETRAPARWAALRLLEGDQTLLDKLEAYEGRPLREELSPLLEKERAALPEEALRDGLVESIFARSESICRRCVQGPAEPDERRLRIDRLLTGRFTGTLAMLLLLALVFYITISGANLPSALLSRGLFYVLDRVRAFLVACHLPEGLVSLIADGGLRVLFWVVSVMLPPMAIFFPLFTLLEDVGYLPRVAFNLDHAFQRCRACGKQCLTMLMGFGCNAAGVVGCRIIDSPRERLVAVLTNNFVPCNGRFPTLIAILSMFFVGAASGGAATALSALLLTGLILLGVFVTFAVTRLLSVTLLKGLPSSFALELPPFRRPQIGKVLLRSILDRTLFVLGRAAAVAAPAGLLIWMLANLHVGEMSLYAHLTGFLDPAARLFGMDGVILLAFVLGFPANEIVVPLILMGYLSSGTLVEMGELAALKALLTAHGWTLSTALCTLLFSLFHWPCSTTLWSMYRETGSLKWTALGFALPTGVGLGLCFLVNLCLKPFGL